MTHVLDVFPAKENAFSSCIPFVRVHSFRSIGEDRPSNHPSTQSVRVHCLGRYRAVRLVGPHHLALDPYPNGVGCGGPVLCHWEPEFEV